jgi:hypothetical protein
MMAGEQGIIVLVSDSLYRLKYGFTSKTRPALITTEKYVLQASPNLSQFNEVHVLLANSHKLMVNFPFPLLFTNFQVCDVKNNGEIVLKYDLHVKDKAASFLVSSLVGNTLVLGTINSILIFTLGNHGLSHFSFELLFFDFACSSCYYSTTINSFCFLDSLGKFICW